MEYSSMFDALPDVQKARLVRDAINWNVAHNIDNPNVVSGFSIAVVRDYNTTSLDIHTFGWAEISSENPWTLASIRPLFGDVFSVKASIRREKSNVVTVELRDDACMCAIMDFDICDFADISMVVRHRNASLRRVSGLDEYIDFIQFFTPDGWTPIEE